MKKFSKRFRSFPDWLKSQNRSSGYVKRITRLHNLYPKASLDALRGHTVTAKALHRAKPVPLYKRSWTSLTVREKVARQKSLDILSLARRTGESLSKLSKEHGVPIDTVLKNTNAFRKVKGHWKALKSDRIPRLLLINENGREVFVEVNSSKYASLIGKYRSAIKEYLENGNKEALLEFKGKLIRDSEGNYHVLETDPDTIRAMYERMEEPSFNETIYEGLR